MQEKLELEKLIKVINMMGLTHANIQDLTGYTRPHISKIMRGRCPPTFRFVAVLKISLEKKAKEDMKVAQEIYEVLRGSD